LADDVFRFRLSVLRESFQHTRATLALVWKASPRLTAFLAVLTVVSAVLPLGVAYVGKEIMDAVVAHDGRLTLHWVLGELALVAVQALVLRTLGLVRQLLGARLGLDINVRILEKALTLELRHFEDPDFYDRLTRARREASSRPISVVTESFQLVQNVLTLAGYVGLLVRFSGWAVLGLVAAAIPATVAEMRFSALAFRLRNWRSPDSRRLMYLEYVLANDDHAKEVKLFGIGPLLLDRYRSLGETFYLEDRKLAVQRAGWGSGLSMVGTGAFYVCYALMAVATAAGRLTLGLMTLYIVAFRQGQQAFQSILAAVGGMYEDNLYMSNLFEYLAIPTGRAAPAPEVQPLPPGSAPRTRGTPDDPPPADRPGSAPRTRGTPDDPPPADRLGSDDGIQFEDVGFRYPGSESWALRHVSLFIPRGQSLALVGQNGAGKTTFIKLLTRLYEPTEGRILLDGKDLRLWEESTLRQRIGVIFQDFNQYQFRFRENVGFGSVEHVEDQPRLERAVDRGGADEVLKTLPSGLETPLGRWFKEGTELSGGQWQKVALARAFMREEADILVLDEPTASLDAEAEHAIFERFRQLARGRTTLLISHRFSTVRRADRIVVIEHGEIVEQGTHEELMALGRRYAHLFTLQAKGYQ
jgi:ATP-binding cassette subfamily B protein